MTTQRAGSNVHSIRRYGKRHESDHLVSPSTADDLNKIIDILLHIEAKGPSVGPDCVLEVYEPEPIRSAELRRAFAFEARRRWGCKEDILIPNVYVVDSQSRQFSVHRT